MDDLSDVVLSPRDLPEIVLSPSGRLYLEPPDVPGGAPRVRRLCRLWGEDPALGLLELAGEAWDSPPSATLGFWRGFARDYLAVLCQTPNIETDPAAAPEPPDAEHWRAVSERVPPMKGFEYLTPKVLGRLWEALDAAEWFGVRAGRGFEAVLKALRDPGSLDEGGIEPGRARPPSKGAICPRSSGSRSRRRGRRLRKSRWRSGKKPLGGRRQGKRFEKRRGRKGGVRRRRKRGPGHPGLRERLLRHVLAQCQELGGSGIELRVAGALEELNKLGGLDFLWKLSKNTHAIE